MVTSFKRSHAHTTLRDPDSVAGHCQPTLPPETPGPSGSLEQSLVGSLLLSFGLWSTQYFVCTLQKSVSPVLWQFCNQIPLASKVKFPGGSDIFLTLKDEFPRQVGAQYATGDQRRNSSRKNEEMEPKQKQHPVVDVTGDRSKVRCCEEQYCIGTWNVRSMNQGKLEVVKQEMARVNVDILGVSELKWTGMGEFNSDDHYI